MWSARYYVVIMKVDPLLAAEATGPPPQLIQASKINGCIEQSAALPTGGRDVNT